MLPGHVKNSNTYKTLPTEGLTAFFFVLYAWEGLHPESEDAVVETAYDAEGDDTANGYPHANAFAKT